MSYCLALNVATKTDQYNNNYKPMVFFSDLLKYSNSTQNKNKICD